MKSKVSKIVMTLSLVFCMAISMFGMKVNAEESTAASKIDDCERVVKSYDAEEAAEYIAGDNTYPKLDGYLFSGWYTAEACDKDCMLDGREPSGTVYALFVPEHVLSIKAQVSAHLIDDSVTSDDDTASIRFVTTVDSLLYKQVGFEVSYVGSDGTVKTATSASNTVYSKLYQTGSTSEVWEVTPQGTFCGLSRYFKACTVTNVPKANYTTEFTVKPYWITMDGDKVYGVEATKTIEEGCLRKEVYVSASGQDIPYYGTKEYPYATFDYAMTHVKDSGKVNLIDSVAINGEDGIGWPAHGKKNVTITGGTLDVTTDDLFIKDGVIFSNMTLKIAALDTRDFNRIFAEGNDVTISSDVTVSNQEASVQIFGGGSTTDVESTNLKIYAGSYAMICGGSSSKNVTGNVNLTVGGNASASTVYGGCYSGNVLGNVNITASTGMNASADYTDHEATAYQLYGGAYLGAVKGDVNITVEKDAKFNYIYGGVGGNSDNETGTIEGKINIDFAGKAYSIYGGSLHGSNADTCVKVTGGEVYQVFGGSRYVTFEGNTDVQILGGTVHRRIYGGSYNNWNFGWESPSRQVKGYTSVTISSATGINLDKEDDRALVALSRYSEAQTGEWGVLIFEDGLYDTYSSKIGSSSDSLLGIEQNYHYLVKATTDGEVRSAGEYLNIKPDSGYVATVYQVVDGVEVEKHYTESNSYYQLPALSSSTDETEIIVKFGTEKKTDLSGYEGKIGGAYYETLEQALEAIDKYEDAKIEDIGTAKRLVTVTVENSDYGTLAVDKKYCLVGDQVVIQEDKLLDSSYYLAGLLINDEEVELDSDGTYTLTATESSYVIEGIYRKKIFNNNALWDLTQQNQGTDAAGVTSGIITYTDIANTTSWLYLYGETSGAKEYGDIELTLNIKDYSDSITSANTQVKFETAASNDFWFRFVVEETAAGGVKVFRTGNTIGNLSSTPDYEFSAEEIEAYNSENGIDMRVKREGTMFYLYLGKNLRVSLDLSEEISSDTKSAVCILHDNDTNIAVSIPYKLRFPNIRVEDTKYGTVIADKSFCDVGDTIVIQEDELLDSSYYLAGLLINDKEVSLDSDGTYTLTATESSYVIKGLYKKKIFTDSDVWDLTQQNQGTDAAGVTSGKVSLPNGGIGGGDGWLYFIEKYTDIDLTITAKDDPNASGEPRTTIGFTFGDKAVAISLTQNTKGVVVQNYPSITNTINTGWTDYKVLEESEVTQYKSEEGTGLKFRAVRKGTDLVIYVEDVDYDGVMEEAAYVDLSEYGIDAAAEATVAIRHEGESGTAKEIPFEFTTNVAPTIITTTMNDTYGTFEVQNTHNFVGDKILIERTSSYDKVALKHLAGVQVDGETTINLDADATCSFVATKAEHSVEGIYRDTIFTERSTSNWNLTQQNQGTVDGATSGVISIPGNTQSWLYLYETDGNAQYGDVDLTYTLKDFGGTGDSWSQIKFAFGNGKVLQLTVAESSGKATFAQTDHTSMKLGIGTICELDYDKYTSEGIDVGVRRKGTEIQLYIDGVFQSSIDLSEYIEEETLARICINHDGDGGKQVEIPYKLRFPNIIVEDSEYGTPAVDKQYCLVGDEVVIQEGELLDSSYYLAGLLINNEGVELDSDGTYTLTVTESSYVIKGIYRKKVFTDNTLWDLSKQNQGTDANGVTSGVITYTDKNTTSWLYLYQATSGAKAYGDIDLTLNVRNYSDSITNANTQVKFETAASDNYWFRFVVEETAAGGVKVFRTGSFGNLSSTPDYEFSAEEIATYNSENGIDLRVKREGTMVYLYLGENLRVSLDLSEEISSETKAAVSIMHDNDINIAVSIPYELLVPKIRVENSEYGTVIADKYSCNDGETIVIQESELLDSSYYLAGLLINNEEVELDSDGTYSLTVTESFYVVKGIYRQKIFADNALWDLSKQNQGTDANGVTSGVITYTDKNTTSWLYLYQETSGAKEYGDIDLTLNVRNYSDSITTANTQVKFETAASNDFWFRFVVEETAAGGVKVFRTGSFGNLSSTPDYEFSAEEIETYNSENGIDLRVKREGTMVYLYLGENLRVSLDLSDEISSETKAAVSIMHDNDINIAVSIPYKLRFPNVIVEDSEYGTVIADKSFCDVGDTIVITEGELLDSSYYLAGLLINDEEVELDSDGTYTLTATETSYVIEGIYRKKIFVDHSWWDLSQQNQGTDAEGVTSGVITYTKLAGHSATNAFLYLYRETSGAKEYGDIDLTLNIKDYSDSITSANTQVKFETAASDDYWFRFVVEETAAGGVKVFRTGSFGNLSSTPDYEFSAEEIEAYNSENGIDMRVKREGTMFYLYLGENLRVSLDLSGEISSDTKSAVCIVHDNDTNIAVSIPYKLRFPNTAVALKEGDE